MATDLDDVTRRRWEEIGIGMIEPELGERRFEEILSADATQRIVLPMEWSRFFDGRSEAEIPGMLRSLYATVTNGRPGTPSGAGGSSGSAESFESISSPDFSSLEPDEVPASMLDYLERTLAAVLRVNPGDLVTSASITDLGIDSLTALEIKNRVESGTGLTVSIVRLLEGPTLRDLTDELSVQVQAHALQPTTAAAAGTESEVEHFEF